MAFINQLWDGVALYSPSIITNQSHFPNHEHKELINAIKQNDLNTALSVYEQHIVNAKKTVKIYPIEVPPLQITLNYLWGGIFLLFQDNKLNIISIDIMIKLI